MTRIINTETARIDAAMAQRLLIANAYSRQRPISREFVDYLKKHLHDGTFKSGSIELCYLKTNPNASGPESLFLVDGQHRLTAIAEADKTIEMCIVSYRAETEAELNAHYWRTDAGRKRSQNDFWRASALGEELGLHQFDLAKFGHALQCLYDDVFRQRTNSRTRRTDPELMVQWAREWQAEERLFVAALDVGHQRLPKLLKAAAPHAVALVTLRHQREKAEPFWREVAANDGLRVGTPQHTLVELMNRVMINSQPHTWLTRAVSLCWNAYYEGRGLTQVRPDVENPLRIAGTPVGKLKKAEAK